MKVDLSTKLRSSRESVPPTAVVVRMIIPMILDTNAIIFDEQAFLFTGATAKMHLKKIFLRNAALD